MNARKKAIGKKLRRVAVLTLAIVMLLSAMMPVASASGGWRPTPASNPFTDVQPSDWHHNYVSWAWINGITTGTSATTFAPNDNVTRAQFATFMHRVAGRPHASPSTFADSGTIESWAVTAVGWASNSGVTTGFRDDNTFRPNSNITREQIATMLHRHAQNIGLNTTVPANALDAFPDRGHVSDWATSAMRWAVHHRIITGMNGNLASQSNASRAMTVTMLNRFVNTFSIPAVNLPDAPGTPPQMPQTPPPQTPIRLHFNNHTRTEGSLTTASPIITYRLDLPSAGRLTINLTRPATGGFPNNGAEVRWLDETRTQMVTNTVGSGAFTRFVDLEAGTYFIEIERRSNNTGRYFIAATFDAAWNNHDRVLNRTIVNAQPLFLNQPPTAGFLSHQNRVDVYRIEVLQPGRVTVSLSSPSSSGFSNANGTTEADVKWMDINGVTLITDRVGSGAYTRFLDLEAGIYFVEISRRNISTTGNYSLSARFTS